MYLEHEGLTYLASIMSARQLDQLARVRDRSLTARLLKEIYMDKEKLLPMYEYVQKEVYPYSPEFFDVDDHHANPVFTMATKD